MALLRASVWSDDRGRRSWEQLSLAEVAQSPLLALLGRNLPGWGAGDDWRLACRRAAQRNWWHNETQLKHAREAAEALSSPPVLLKGAAMVLAYYEQTSLRRMGDVDMWVEHTEAPTAAEQWHALGWRYAPRDYSLSGLDFEVWHAYPLRGPHGCEIDLHGHFLNERCLEAFSRDMARGARPLPGWPARVLAPERQMLHLIAHALRWQRTPNLVWMADVACVLDRTPNLDWNELARLARRYALGYTLGMGLQQLQSALDLPIAKELIADLKHDASAWEKLELHLKCRPPWRWGNLPVYCVRYPLLERLQGRWPTPWGLCEFLRRLLGCRHYRQVPGALRQLGEPFRQQLAAR